MLIHAVGQPDLAPLAMPDRFRTEIAYFMTPFDEAGVPPLAADEYWIRRDNAQQWLEDFVVELVSPLDATAKTEIELTDYQEAWLEWLLEHRVEHVRIE